MGFQVQWISSDVSKAMLGQGCYFGNICIKINSSNVGDDIKSL
jgi:hypothetical protein